LSKSKVFGLGSPDLGHQLLHVTQTTAAGLQLLKTVSYPEGARTRQKPSSAPCFGNVPHTWVFTHHKRKARGKHYHEPIDM